MSGGYEFMPQSGHKKPGEVVLPALLKAYEFLDYDLMLVSRIEAGLLEQRERAIPADWRIADVPGTKVLDSDGVKVGFAWGPGAGDGFASFLEAVEALRAEADIIVGLSAWGYTAEMEFLERHPRGVHILLGSGEGPGLPGKISDDGRTAWVRAYTKGKAVSRIEVLRIPTGPDFTWTVEEDIRFEIDSLTGDVSNHEQMLQILP